ncbi:MAG: MYXO-CTERM domain-containing protein/uncharacterized repeat protein (TIGR01451 family), partial [Myxococcota bacterium]
TADAADSTEAFIDLLLFADNPLAPTISDFTPHGVALDPLGPGQSFETVFTVDYEVGGNYNVWLMIDSISFAGLGPFGLPEESKNNNLIGPTTVTVIDTSTSDEPDLLISAFTAMVDEAQVQYSLTIQNVGATTVAAGAYVDVLFAAPGGVCPPPEWQAAPVTLYGDVDQMLPAIGPGASVDVKLIGAPGAGTHVSCAMVDLDDQVDESNELNNIEGPVTIFVEDQPDPQCPDLRIETFNVQALAGVVTYTVKVTNNGPSAAGAFTVDLYDDSGTQPVKEEPALHFWTVPSLGVGASWQDSHTEPAASNGQKSAWVWIDKEDATKDCVAANNIEGPYPYTVAVADNKPDLVILGDIEWSIAGTSLCYEMTVHNKGTTAATNAPIDLFFSHPTNPDCLDPNDDLSDAPVQTQVIDELGPGATVTLDFCWTDPVDGDHTSWGKIDCFNELDESDETNNDKGPVAVSYTTPVTDGPDLFLADFKGKVTCTNVDYVAKICNTGDEDAPPFQIDLYYNKEVNPNFDGGPGEKTIFYGSDEPLEPGLKAGECIDVVLRRDAADSGTYQSWLVLDTALQVAEKTPNNPAGEGNNIGKVNIVVDAEGCRCSQNEPVGGACNCGGQTVSEGYCCNGNWQLGAFDLCGDVGTGDGDTNGADGVSGGGDVGGTDGMDSDDDIRVIGGPNSFVDANGGNDAQAGDCSAAPTGDAPVFFGMLLLLVALAFRLRQRAKPLTQLARSGGSRRAGTPRR